MTLSFILYVLATVSFFLALIAAEVLPWTGLGLLLLAAGHAAQNTTLK